MPPRTASQERITFAARRKTQLVKVLCDALAKAPVAGAGAAAKRRRTLRNSVVDEASRGGSKHMTQPAAGQGAGQLEDGKENAGMHSLAADEQGRP